MYPQVSEVTNANLVFPKTLSNLQRNQQVENLCGELISQAQYLTTAAGKFFPTHQQLMQGSGPRWITNDQR